MTWPKAYGGHEHSFLERFVVTEELLEGPDPQCSERERIVMPVSGTAHTDDQTVSADVTGESLVEVADKLLKLH